MKNKLLPILDKLLLRKRFLIETVNDPLKHLSQSKYAWHRSVTNFLVNLVAGLIIYTYALYPYTTNGVLASGRPLRR